MPPDPPSLFTVKRTQWSYQSKIAGSGPALVVSACCYRGHYADDNTCVTETGKWHVIKLPLIGNRKLARSLEPRLSVPDFVLQLWRKISCEAKIWNGKPGFKAS